MNTKQKELSAEQVLDMLYEKEGLNFKDASKVLSCAYNLNKYKLKQNEDSNNKSDD